ncbi:MAG: TonB-dependent receptor [SAR324 cluster bacterium]|nr:TonB-dependent receptor [SAR324 cluster bacterium]
METLDAYALINVAVTYDYSPMWRFYGRVDNLSDAYYEDAWSYGTSGRAMYAGIKATF